MALLMVIPALYAQPAPTRVSPPSVLSKVEPEYTEEARTAKLQGIVVLSLVVDDQGRPQNLKIERSLGLGLDQKAIEAVQKWRYKPAMKDGRAVTIPAQIEVSFRLPVIASAGASVLSAEPHTISPPPNWETWWIADNCVSAVEMFAARNAKDLGNFHLEKTWPSFKAHTKVDARIEDACTYVVLDEDRKVFGWVATDLATDLSDTLRSELLAKDKQLAAEIAARNKQLAAQEVAAKETREKQLAAARAEREKRFAEEKARVAYIQSLPAIDNGNQVIFVGNDRKCSEQFVQALSMEGLEKRKRIAELVSFQCGYLEDRGMHVKRLQTQATFCLISPAEGEHAGQSGWVPCTWIK